MSKELHHHTAIALLCEFVEHHGIAHYDSTICWGCGEPKIDQCLPECLLRRSRELLELWSITTVDVGPCGHHVTHVNGREVHYPPSGALEIKCDKASCEKIQVE